MYLQQPGMFPRERLARTLSAQQASSSHHLLRALEDGGIEDVRAVLLNTPEGLMRSALLSASYDCRHALRTPLMAAARTGNYAIFTTIMNSIDRLFSRSRPKRAEEMRRQMLERDRDGFTVAMHAARAKHIVVLETVLAEIVRSDAIEALMARDHKQMTLLMHAAAAGHAAGFQDVVSAIEASITEPRLAEHMMMRSGDDQTLFMIAAASRDKMTFKACVDKLRFLITPHDFRIMMRERDADGMTFLMHAANPKSHDYPVPGQSSAATAAAASTRAEPVPFPIRHMQQRPVSAGGASVSEAPSVLGPGGSEEVLRRHSLQRGVIGGEHPQGEAVPAKGSSSGVAGESKLEVAPLYEGVQQMSARGDGLDVSFPGSVADSATEEAPAGRGQGGGAAASAAAAVAAAAVAAAAAVDSKGSRIGLNQRERQHQQQHPQQPTVHGEGLNADGMDVRVPVLKAAVTLNKECLWKEQVRDMLTAKDSWGRTLISHGILSGNPQVFEVAVEAVRADVLDEEVQELLQTADHNNKKQPLTMAKLAGGKEMESSVQRHQNNLKRDVEHRARASTFEAKIQSFIPGKLIVIFQLLLPEIPWSESGHERLALLAVMSFLAPFLAWASGLVHRMVSSPDGPVMRRSSFSYFLSAPAMFVWGVGTSSIFEDDFGWPESRAAVVLAVGTIVIPAVDGFVNSQRVEQWNDKFSFSRWRFSKQADIAWKRAKDEAERKKADNAAVFRKVGTLFKAKRALLPNNRGGVGESTADRQPAKLKEEEEAPAATLSSSGVAPISEVAEQKSSET